jgi:hypothetical protein
LDVTSQMQADNTIQITDRLCSVLINLLKLDFSVNSSMHFANAD